MPQYEIKSDQSRPGLGTKGENRGGRRLAGPLLRAPVSLTVASCVRARPSLWRSNSRPDSSDAAQQTRDLVELGHADAEHSRPLGRWGGENGRRYEGRKGQFAERDRWSGSGRFRWLIDERCREQWGGAKREEELGRPWRWRRGCGWRKRTRRRVWPRAGLRDGFFDRRATL